MQGNQNDYWILALDGGGVRCVIQLVLLKRIFTRFPQLEEKIRLVAGTSAGAIVGASIAAKGFDETYRLMFTPTFMQRIFATSYSHDALTVNGWRLAMFSNENLATLLREHFAQDELMKSFPKSPERPHLLIPTFCVDRLQYRQENEAKSILSLDNDDDDDFFAPATSSSSSTPPSFTGEWCPRIYHSFNSHSGHGDTPVRDVLLQSTAAPTYFPVYKGCVDGGVMANAPCLVALTTAIECGRIGKMADVCMLSIGTGIWPSNLNGYGENADLGKLQWIPNLATLMIDSSVEIATTCCRQLLGRKGFHRIQPCLPRYIALHDYLAFDELVKLAEQVDLSTTFAWIEHRLGGGDSAGNAAEKDK